MRGLIDLHEYAEMLGCCAHLGASAMHYGGLQHTYMQVSRVLKLPIPAKSTQLLGKDFVGEEGRGANLIDIGNGVVVVRASLPDVPARRQLQQWLIMACSANVCHLYINFLHAFCRAHERQNGQVLKTEHGQPCDMKTAAMGEVCPQADLIDGGTVCNATGAIDIICGA